MANQWPVAAGLQPYQVIFDNRFAVARAFALQAARAGIPTVPIAGDVTALWFGDLGVRWSTAAVADDGLLTGLTTARTLLCLEQLAHGSWRRVLSRSERRALQSGAQQPELVSWVIGGRP